MLSIRVYPFSSVVAIYGSFLCLSVSICGCNLWLHWCPSVFIRVHQWLQSVVPLVSIRVYPCSSVVAICGSIGVHPCLSVFIGGCTLWFHWCPSVSICGCYLSFHSCPSVFIRVHQIGTANV